MLDKAKIDNRDERKN